jgi:glycosyltransferase involved in cell wall biosynthesis
MKVAQVVPSYHPQIGGVQTHVQNLANGCVKVGDSVTVFTHQIGHAPADEWIEGVHVIRFPLTVKSEDYLLSISLFKNLNSYIDDFDIIHTHNYHSILGQAVASIDHVPFIFTPHYHGTGHTPLRAFLHKIYKPFGARQFKTASTIICVSDAERELIVRDFPISGDKVVTIPNGTDARVAPTHADNTNSQPMVLSIGRLERYKNVDLIINAFRALPFSATLVVVGDGPDRRRLERIAQDVEPGRKIRFMGRVSDSLLDALLTEATVVTSASDHEAFGLCLADGLASGARIVASSIPAHAEIASLAGVNAPISLVDPRNTARFTEFLESSLRAGRSEPDRVRLPTWDDTVGATRELYSRAVSKTTDVHDHCKSLEPMTSLTRLLAHN